MRHISFSLTTAQFLDGSKTVTRRIGWERLKPGTRLMAVEKSRGLKKGEKVRKLGETEIVSVRRELLSEILGGEFIGEGFIEDFYGELEVVAEGFPELSPEEFIAYFCEKNHCMPGDFVTRIEFKRIVTP